jgi:hypothetical protein
MAKKSNPYLERLNLKVDFINDIVPGIIERGHYTSEDEFIMKYVNYFLDVCDNLGVKTYVK